MVRVGRAKQIRAAHRERVEPELAAIRSSSALEGVATFDRAVAAHGAARRQVGIDAIAVELDRRNVVDALQQRAGIEDGDDAVAGIGAAALHHLAGAGGDPPVATHAELEQDVGLRAAAVGEEALLARQLHHDRAGRRAREQGGDDLEVQRLDAGAETAADERLDHADAGDVHLQAARQHELEVVGDLGHALHGEALRARLVFGERRMWLDLRMIDFAAADAIFAHQIGRANPAATSPNV